MFKKIFILVVILCLGGCASIFEGANQNVTIRTTPEAATILITNHAGKKVYVGTTPTTVRLARAKGYFKSEEYKVTLSKDGYITRQIVLTGSANGWYFANILFGGIIGLVLIDPATGAMYSLAPTPITATLEQTP